MVKCSSGTGTLIPYDRCTGRLWKVGISWSKIPVAFGIVHVSKPPFERFYRRGAVELIHESSRNFGGGSRPVLGRAAQDQPSEFWSFFR